jgi:hypothetical protein
MSVYSLPTPANMPGSQYRQTFSGDPDEPIKNRTTPKGSHGKCKILPSCQTLTPVNAEM